MDTLRSLTMALVTAMVLPAAVGAQALESESIDVDVRGGVAIPAGDFADVADTGADVGLGFAYWLNDHLAVRTDGDVGFFTGADMAEGGHFADSKLWHYNGGLEVALLGRDQEDTPWTVTADAGVGATTLDTENFTVEGARFTELAETWVSVNGGVDVGYELNEKADLVVGGDAYLAFADEEDTREFTGASRAADPLDTVWHLPVTAELQIRLP